MLCRLHAATATLAIAFCCPALCGAEQPPDTTFLSHLEQKVEQASLRDRCYLYAQLIRGLTEAASYEAAIGDRAAIQLSLTEIHKYSTLLMDGLSSDTRKLKDAEILLRESAFRLRAAMHASSADDRTEMASAVDDLDGAETRVMRAVFAQ